MIINRREFLKRVLATTAVILTEPQIEKVLEESNHLNDIDFMMWIQCLYNMQIDKPTMCGIIDGIVEP